MPERGDPYIACFLFESDENFPGHCPMCHDDRENFGDDIVGVDVDGFDYQVCCDIFNEFFRHGVDGGKAGCQCRGCCVVRQNRSHSASVEKGKA